MNIDDFLKLPAISFFDELMQSEVSKTDIIRYIDENFDNNTDLLKAFKEDAASYKLYYDTEYREKYHAEQSAILGKQLRNGEKTTIPYHYEPDIQMVVDEVKKIDDFKDMSWDEKREMREKINDKLLASYPPNKPKTILLDIKYPYNWDTHNLAILINILDKKINHDQSNVTNSNYRIAKGQKINFIKIINAMRELNMFETPDGLLVSNKQKFIKDLALFFNENIEDYSQSLSASKGNKNYLDIFDKLKEIAEKDLD